LEGPSVAIVAVRAPKAVNTTGLRFQVRCLWPGPRGPCAGRYSRAGSSPRCSSRVYTLGLGARTWLCRIVLVHALARGGTVRGRALPKAPNDVLCFLSGQTALRPELECVHQPRIRPALQVDVPLGWPPLFGAPMDLVAGKLPLSRGRDYTRIGGGISNERMGRTRTIQVQSIFDRNLTETFRCGDLSVGYFNPVFARRRPARPGRSSGATGRGHRAC